MRVGAHQNHLLGTGNKIYLKFEGNAKEYNDEDSVGYDDDDDGTCDDALSSYSCLIVADSFERKLQRKYDEEQEAEQTRISS